MKSFTRLAVAVLLLLPQMTVAAPWYSQTLSAFESASYVDGKNFKAGEFALREEFVELTLKLLGGKVHIPFGEPVFDDVAVVSPLFPVFQEGARGAWVLGVKSCAGNHPCYAAPVKPVNRAEAAALIVRAFQLKPGPAAPGFTDNLPNQWYTDYISTAASRCILQGDGGKQTVRPGSSMNRAEMLAMLLRAMQSLTYPECSADEANPLPLAQEEFTLVQSTMSVPPQQSASSSLASVASVASAPSSASSVSTPPPAQSSSESPPASSAQAAGASSAAASSSFSSIPAFDFSLLVGSSSSSMMSASSAAAASSQDAGYPDLLARFQQYIMQFSNLIARARSADSAAALQLLNVLRTQIDLLNELYPYVVYAKSRPLSAGEWSVVLSLESNIRSGFAAAP